MPEPHTRPKDISLGFIGIGLMGEPMSQRLLAAGYPLWVWNRTPEKCDSLVYEGAVLAESIAALVEQSDIVMLCLTDTTAVEAVVFSDAFLQHANAGKILVDFSSIDPQQTAQFAKKLNSATGMQWIDSPVSGGVAGAESGKLVIMAGGNEADIQRVQPVLTHVSQRVTHMGPVGSGQATKVCNQMIVSCNVLVMAEVLALAKKAGIHSEKIPAALAGGFADSIPFQLTGQRMVDGDFADIKWHTKTLAKDLDLAAVLADSTDASTPMAELAQQLMRSHCDAGFAELDPANLIKAYLDQ